MKLEIDVSKSALLMLHCQNDIAKPEGKFAFSGVPAQVAKHNLLEKWAVVLKASRDAGMCVIYINNVLRPGFPELAEKTFPIMVGAKEHGAFVKGTWGAENPDEIKPLSGDLIIENYNTSAFSYTNLDQILRANEIKHLFLAGLATTFVVDSTTRYGAELGYDITIVEDCCTSFTDEMHDFEIANVLPQFGTISRSSDIIAALSKK
ncbi:Peroxyureidoacrylate/ureidoacrylate amidohydrolase RutB [subsurface metagenome]